ncbi:hypothetical protein BSKO_02811 [Bryopsis sp. KO-2023]|nr:hypothetical protein BSKO_02811 [Bryopsis sp. KO-2023]
MEIVNDDAIEAVITGSPVSVPDSVISAAERALIDDQPGPSDRVGTPSRGDTFSMSETLSTDLGDSPSPTLQSSTVVDEEISTPRFGSDTGSHTLVLDDPRRAATASFMLGDLPESDREVVNKLQGWGRIANVLLFGVAAESMVVWFFPP